MKSLRCHEPKDVAVAMGSNNKVLVVTELFLPTKGGTAVWFDEVYRRLGGKGTHILTAEVSGAAEYDTTHPNSVHRVSLKRHAWLRPESLIMYLKLLARSLALSMRFDFEAVHAGRVLPEGLVAWFVARLIRKPVVIYAHGEEITTWRQSGKYRIMRFTYRHADKVIANSDFTREELIKLNVAPERITLISPGVDIEKFKPGLESADLRAQVGAGPDQLMILSVGRLSRRKGFDQVIKSLPSLVEKGLDVHYVIIGIGEDRDYLQDLASQDAVAGRVHLLGHVEMADLPRWYNACDVFVMSNREINGDTEGFGIVFLEAAASAKPVIAGMAGGTADSVVDGVTGLRIDGNCSATVANGLYKLLSDPILSKRMGEDGLKRVLKNYTWESVARNTQAMMQKMHSS